MVCACGKNEDYCMARRMLMAKSMGDGYEEDRG